MALPMLPRKFFGHTLDFAQRDQTHAAAEVLQGFGGAGMLEVVEYDISGPYRAVYTIRFAEAVFVLRCFQKKSKQGIATPKEDMEIIRIRRKAVEKIAQDLNR